MNYGVNEEIHERFPSNIAYACMLNAAQNPSELMSVMDAGTHRMIPSFANLDNPSIEDYYYLPGFTSNAKAANLAKIADKAKNDAEVGRHGNKQVNVCYADGHVATIKSETTAVKATHNTIQDGNNFKFWRPNGRIIEYNKNRTIKKVHY